MCSYSKQYKIYTEDQEKTKSDIATDFVWSILSIGSTYSLLKELLSVRNIPYLTRYEFNKIELQLKKVSGNNKQ